MPAQNTVTNTTSTRGSVAVQKLASIARPRDHRKPAKKWGLGFRSPHSAPVDQHPTLTDEDVASIAQSMKTTCGWGGEPRPFQLAGIKAQLEGIDTIIQASTGAGKTAIAAGPHFHRSSAGKCTIMVEPLIQLQDEMVTTFANEFKLKALAVNSKTGILSPVMVNEIISGKYQVILVSPEMLQSRSFMNKILRTPSFAHRVLSIFIDEAHCISHWGANFRKKYSTLGIVRAFLPRGVPVMAVTATLTAKVRRDIQSKLHFPKSGSMFLNIGNDRSNVSLVTRACEHPMHTFADLDFVIPAQVTAREDIPKTYIYVDNIKEGSKMIDHLYDVLRSRNPALADEGIIRPFNAVLSHEYRTKAMSSFREGTIRVLVCTDAAGMGCNIPDIDIVIQWQLPATLSNWVQRAGRAARGHGRKGLAVLLVEPSAYKLDPSKVTDKKETRSKKGAKQRSAKPTMPKASQYAMEHGVKRGGLGKKDARPTGEQPPLNLEREDEGLLAYVHSTQCRRKVWHEAFENGSTLETANNTIEVPCCDICNPELLERTRPGRQASKTRTSKVPTKGFPDHAARAKLEDWRDAVFARDHAGSQLDPTAILDDATVELLCSVGPLKDDAQVRRVVKKKWIWWDKYGQELSTFVQGLDITFRPLKPKKASAKAKKDLAATPRKHKGAMSDTSAPDNATAALKRRRRAITTDAHSTGPTEFTFVIETGTSVPPPRNTTIPARNNEDIKGTLPKATTVRTGATVTTLTSPATGQSAPDVKRLATVTPTHLLHHVDVPGPAQASSSGMSRTNDMGGDISTSANPFQGAAPQGAFSNPYYTPVTNDSAPPSQKGGSAPHENLVLQSLQHEIKYPHTPFSPVLRGGGVDSPEGSRAGSSSTTSITTLTGWSGSRGLGRGAADVVAMDTVNGSSTRPSTVQKKCLTGSTPRSRKKPSALSQPGPGQGFFKLTGYQHSHPAN